MWQRKIGIHWTQDTGYDGVCVCRGVSLLLNMLSQVVAWSQSGTDVKLAALGIWFQVGTVMGSPVVCTGVSLKWVSPPK